MIPLAVVTTLLSFPFALSDYGFMSTGATGQWQWGVPGAGPGSVEPMWGTRLSADYYNASEDTLDFGEFDLTGLDRPTLVMSHWYAIQSGDWGRLQVWEWGAWRTLQPIYGYPRAEGFSGESRSVQTNAFLLADYGPVVKIRAVFSSDSSGASAGWYLRDLAIADGDVSPPRLQPLAQPTSTEDLQGPYDVRFQIDDDVGVREAWLRYGVNGQLYSELLVNEGAGVWSGSIPGQPANTEVFWEVFAFDNEQMSVWPVSGMASFRVALPAPVSLAMADLRPLGSSVTLTWSPPDTAHPVLGYSVYLFGVAEPVASVESTSASVEVHASGWHEWEVRASYHDGEGDPSVPVKAWVTVPKLSSVQPESGWPGETLHVELSGDALYLESSGLSVDMGSGTSVSQVRVLDVNRVALVVTVDENARGGARDIRISSAGRVVTGEGLFFVNDLTERPHIVSVYPNSVEQGQTLEVRFSASQAFAGEVFVDLPPGLLQLSEPEWDEDSVRLVLRASQNTTPGDRLTLLDDGERVWPATLTVRELFVTVGGPCQTGGGSTGLGGLCVLWFFRRRS